MAAARGGKKGKARVRARGVRGRFYGGERRERGWLQVEATATAPCACSLLSPYRGGKTARVGLASGVGHGPTRLAKTFFNCFCFSFLF